MRFLRNKNAPPLADLVQTYIGTAYDNVKAVADELDALVALGEAVIAGEVENHMSADEIDSLAKLNALVLDATLLADASAFATAAQGVLADNAIAGPFSSQGEAEGGTDNTRAMTPLRTAQAIAVFASGLLNKYDGTMAPGVGDDSASGFAVGSTWIDIVASPNEAYRCVDASVGAAAWVKTTLTTDELATIALSGDSDDLIEGAVKLLMTVTERSKLTGIAPNATIDQTGAAIKSLYEAELQTNAFTDTEKTRLAGMQDNSTADQTDAEIETAYNAQVAVVSQAAAEAGSSTTPERWTPERVKQAILALETGVEGAVYRTVTGTTDTLLASDNGKVLIYTNAAAIAVTLPADLIVSWQCTVIQTGAGVPTVTRSGSDTINGATIGVTPAGQWKGMYLSQFAEAEFVALL